MILGIGTDIVDMRRIDQSIQNHGDRFIHRVFTPYEKGYCTAKKALSNYSFSKIFAAKEALIKAIGDTKGIQWKDLEVRHKTTGQPFMHVYGAAETRIKELLGNCEEQGYPSVKINLSLSDEPPYALAFVVISRE
jgi:holo-[acyl-carrier protein] synthase